MMDGFEDSPNLLAEDKLSDEDGFEDRTDLLAEDQQSDEGRSQTVDLTDNSLLVDISDSLSERVNVKFTVHTKTTLPQFQKAEMSVVRQHEEFIWLHDRFVENEEYAGVLIPPAPPRPNFESSREKLQRLAEGEGTMTRDEFRKMKQELEAEYLATFKKTVAMHEVFLQRLAAHPILRQNVNFEVFLEYEGDLSVRGKNKKEKIGGFFNRVSKSVDETLLSGHKDVDDYFEKEKLFVLGYYVKVKDATNKCDKLTTYHKDVANIYSQIASGIVHLGSIESVDLDRICCKVAETFDKASKLEGRVASDEDLKLGDTFRYYMRDSSAVKDLLYRRIRFLANYEAANKCLEKARSKNKDVLQAEQNQELCCRKFEKISEVGKQEIEEFNRRRLAYFKKNLVELAELEIRHAKAQAQMLTDCIASLQEES